MRIFNIKFKLEITMSDWIDEEAEKYRTKKELESKKEDLMLRSEYWTEVRVQIEKDVAQINNHPVWKEALVGRPLEITKVNSGYEIKKQRFPEVTISVLNKDEEIELITKIKKKVDEKPKPDVERLKLNSDGEKVYLECQNSEILHIPEETAKYILTPIIKALNGEL